MINITIIAKNFMQKEILEFINAINKETKLTPFYNFLSTNYVFRISKLNDIIKLIDALDVYDIRIEIKKDKTEKNNYLLILNKVWGE